MLYAIVFQTGILVPFCSRITENPNLIPPEIKNLSKFLTKKPIHIDATTPDDVATSLPRSTPDQNNTTSSVPFWSFETFKF